MTTYQPLTKRITDTEGNETVVCRFYGTAECQKIHNSKCNNCPMLSIILKQLNAFEEVYLESLQSE